MSQSASSVSIRQTGSRVKLMVNLAMLCSVSYVVLLLSKMIPISIAGFLNFDFKDMVIAIAGFLFGPLPAVAVTVVVSVIEMLTISDTGPIGLLMNVLATCAFVCPAAYFYKKNHTLKNAIIGLVCGVLMMTAMMLLWNYLITPWYMGVDRGIVVSMLIPIFLPFNLLKAGMNAALTILLYKPVVTVLRKVRLVDERAEQSQSGSKWGGLLLGLVVMATCVLLALVMAGVL